MAVELYRGESEPVATNPVLRGVDLAMDRLVREDCFTERTLRVLDELRAEVLGVATPEEVRAHYPADPVHPPMPVGHIRACGCPECVAWLEAQEPGEPSPCAGCGGDGVQIDDDPESTRQIVSTCGECRGSGSAVQDHTNR